MKRLAVGSVSEGVVGLSPCPALVMRGGEGAWPPSRLVVGADSSEEARETAERGRLGLFALGAGSTVEVLGEPITYRVLYPMTFDLAKAPIVSAAITLSVLMAIFGTSRLRALRSGDA